MRVSRTGLGSRGLVGTACQIRSWPPDPYAGEIRLPFPGAPQGVLIMRPKLANSLAKFSKQAADLANRGKPEAAVAITDWVIREYGRRLDMRSIAG